ncbi:FAD-binding oxidoreductase [Salinigranum marinum]|uniref:FAD-binding oxidoreductase n=1 Tax=Salinigranum marinum TaxID=1515595 RepID=UPI002989E579|nr:FAD-binding oxidoreductase [Salinigranum marinum]
MAVGFEIDDAVAQELRDGFIGDVLLSEDEEAYDEARSVWNGMIDRRPAIIARVAGTADVVKAVNVAREHDLLVSVKGAGHNIAGNAVCDDGLMIDLSRMKSVQVDPGEKIARVEPGVVLSEFDHEAQAFGLATPVGYNSTTGIAGLTLGGGFGWLSRKHGLTADNLLSADVVTAAGEFVHASEEENAELFWGLRGGSGNFGIVTSFTFRLHEVGPDVLSGLLVYPIEDATEALRGYRDFTAGAPDEVTAWFVLRHAPPLPFLAEEWHGAQILAIAVFYAGDMDEGEAAFQPLRAVGDPIADVVSPHVYAEWQQAFDGLHEPGARNYWKSHNFVEITDEMIDTFVDSMATMPSPISEIAVAQLGGAINDVPVEATAYPHRNAEFLMNLHTRWENPGQDDECIAWARELYDAMTPHATGGVYVNFVPEDVGQEQAAYRENYERLVALKSEYDPENLFRMNQNVKPVA